MISISWLGHATVMLELDGVRVLTDPLLAPHAGLLRRRTPPPVPAQWRDPNAVLVSHLHHDHAQLGSLRMLGRTPIMSAGPNVTWLRKHGIGEAVALDESWTRLGESVVEVRLVRADHRHRLMPHRPNDAHGQLLRGPSGAVWVAGDTSLYPEMSAVPDLAGGRLDLAVVPVGGWGPRLSPGHMDAAQAATAVAWSRARWAVPVHWGTLHPPLMDRLGPRGWLDTPGPDFVREVATQAPGCTAVLLRSGEVATLHPPQTMRIDEP